MKKTKLHLILIILTMTALIFTGCPNESTNGKTPGNDTVNVTSVQIRVGVSTASPENFTLYEPADTDPNHRKDVQLTAYITPINSTNKNVTWTKDDQTNNVITL